MLEPRTVPDYNLLFVTRGRAVWYLQDQALQLSPGDLAVVPPEAPHHAKSLTKRITILSIHVDVYLPGRHDAFALLTPPRQQRVAAGSALDGYLRHAACEFDRPNKHAAHVMLASWGRLVALELLRDNAQRGLLTYQPIDPLVSETMDRLQQNLATTIHLNDLAAWSGFTAQHLNRRFRQNIGVTPLQYLARLRMDHAAALLRDGRLTVQAVANRVGFSDPYYFSRAFKQHFGRSPDHYRQAADHAASAHLSSDSPS